MKTRNIFVVAFFTVFLITGCDSHGKGRADALGGTDAGSDATAADSRRPIETNAVFDTGVLVDKRDAVAVSVDTDKDIASPDTAPVTDSDSGTPTVLDAGKDTGLDADVLAVAIASDARSSDSLTIVLDADQDGLAVDAKVIIVPPGPDAAHDMIVVDTVPWGPEVLLPTPDAFIATPDAFVGEPDTLPFSPDIMPDATLVCSTGTLCGSSCVDTLTDPGNCGTCGHACPADNSCYGGVCSCYHVVPEAAYGDNHEIHLHCGAAHFSSIVITNASVGGSFSAVLRSKPGIDINGWGPGHHLAAFLGDSDAAGPVRPSVSATASADGITIVSSGSVNRAGGSYGTWSTSFLLVYDQAGKRVSASGSYQVNLAGSLAAAGADLNLGRMASNHLIDVPLQCGGLGDTGDTAQVRIERVGLSMAVWDWTAYPSTCPSEQSTNMTIDAVGNCNDVDTKAMELTDPTIDSVYKPGYRLNFESLSGTPMMIFCGTYTKGVTDDRCPGIDVSRCPFDDNLGMEHIVKQGTENGTSLSFKLNSVSYAMPGDGAASCCP